MRPTEINLHKKSNVLELAYEDGVRHELPAEYLRVYSPSAEVRGHGPGEEKLQMGKEFVEIDNLVPVGNYAIQIVFSDKHDSGIFDWGLLFDLGEKYGENWNSYLERLKEAGYTRKTRPN
jgi:DUF971 family protein